MKFLNLLQKPGEFPIPIGKILITGTVESTEKLSDFESPWSKGNTFFI